MNSFLIKLRKVGSTVFLVPSGTSTIIQFPSRSATMFQLPAVRSQFGFCHLQPHCVCCNGAYRGGCNLLREAPAKSVNCKGTHLANYHTCTCPRTTRRTHRLTLMPPSRPCAGRPSILPPAVPVPGGDTAFVAPVATATAAIATPQASAGTPLSYAAVATTTTPVR